ncbi:dihydrofolate reductase family protein [Bdellovibrio reynosensis]|uniref:Dihydrofolate reductase family protein n=1 Tax=Bdellovibrio reynosensis TaxID=2835041 RepID=A0ABY4CD38_9BACT|nr:dihydrofolate reductase family protein [Bdellovibrio reynosensis]UOF00115.1 dihydrofolate reductase family protein [Bdellovibrio reynosensis]
MRKVSAFNSISLDGYFTDKNSDMSWAHCAPPDEDFDNFVKGNAGGGGTLLFGRKTFQMMESFWPTEEAKKMMPEIADGMNRMEKIVFSKTLSDVTWNNSRLVKGDLVEEVRKLKNQDGIDITILGSGSIISQLSEAGLIDDYSVVVIPVVLGSGRTQFEGLQKILNLKLTNSRTFKNGNVFLSYSPS